MSNILLLLFLAVLVILLIGLLVFHLDLQQALRWWTKRQTVQLREESDRIRDGLLQELFTIRRRLELSTLKSSQADFKLEGDCKPEDDFQQDKRQNDEPGYEQDQEYDLRQIERSPFLRVDRAGDQLGDRSGDQALEPSDWLTQVEQIHRALEALSDQLSPPYLEEGLPLAIQALLQRWAIAHPLLNLQTELPSHWANEPIEQSQTLLNLLSEALRIALLEPLNAAFLAQTQLWVYMRSIDKYGELTLKITYPNAEIAAATDTRSLDRELTYLSYTFQYLNSGQCSYERNGIIAQWHFRWRIASSS